MSLDVTLRDSWGREAGACVKGNGQIVVGPFSASTASTVTLDTASTSYNMWGPSVDKNFVITDILIYANKNVGVNDATLVIYESTDGPATGTQSKILLNTEMVKQTTRDLVGLNLQVTEGSWVNAETDDDDIFLTVMGYYSPTVGDLT